MQLPSLCEGLQIVLLPPLAAGSPIRHALFSVVHRNKQLIRDAHRELEEMAEKPRSHLVDGHRANLGPQGGHVFVFRQDANTIHARRAWRLFLRCVSTNSSVESPKVDTLLIISSEAGDADESCWTSRTWQFDHFLLASVDQLLHWGYRPCSQRCFFAQL